MISLLMLSGTVYGQQSSSNSLFRRATEHSNIRGQMSGGGGGGGGGSSSNMGGNRGGSGSSSKGMTVSGASWYMVAQPAAKGFHVHDLVTIMVHEGSSHASKADTKSERSWELDASIEDYITLTNQAMRLADKTHGNPAVKMGYDKTFEGKGDVKREDSVSAQVMAEVVDVLPNGNLLLEATSTIVTDDEVTTITLAGMCRTKDVTIANTVLSSQLANLSLRKDHSGVATDATKRGLLSGILDALAIF